MKSIINFLLLLVATTFAVTLIETYLRYYPFPNEAFMPKECIKSKPYYIEAYQYAIKNAHYPINSRVPLCSTEFNYSNNTDANGFVGWFNYKKDIVVFGDSFAYGYGVEAKNTFASLIGAYNAGISGSTFATHANALEYITPRVDFKIALWVIYPPHIISATDLGWQSIVQIRKIEHPWLFKIIELYNQTYLSRTITATTGASINSSDYYTAEYSLYDPRDSREEAGYIELKDSAIKIANIAKSKGIKIIPIIIPSKLEMLLHSTVKHLPFYVGNASNYNASIPTNRILKAIEIDGIDTKSAVVLSNHFDRYDREFLKKYYFLYDSHFNESGNRLVAKIICESQNAGLICGN